jgi:hypothetical protein
VSRPSPSLSHQIHLALLSAKRVIAPRLYAGRSVEALSLVEIRLRPRVGTGRMAVSVIVRRHEYFPRTIPPAPDWFSATRAWLERRGSPNPTPKRASWRRQAQHEHALTLGHSRK